MNQNKIDIDLKGVPQTLLLPLLGRAKFSQIKNSPIHDERAIQLVQSLNYDFESLLKNVGNRTLFWMGRAYQFDRAIRTYLKTHPNATIVNLGAGLETAFYRVDNGKLTWIDLDLPEVIALREQLLPTPDRVHCIAKSLMDFSWMEDVKKYGNEFLFFAGGVFMYFTKEEVKSLFLQMAQQFPGNELIFDSISTSGLKWANEMLARSNITDAILKWPMDDGKDLETWSPKLKLFAQYPYFTNIKSQFNFSFAERFKMMFYDFVTKGGIMHVRFEK